MKVEPERESEKMKKKFQALVVALAVGTAALVPVGPASAYGPGECNEAGHSAGFKRLHAGAPIPSGAVYQNWFEYDYSGGYLEVTDYIGIAHCTGIS